MRRFQAFAAIFLLPLAFSAPAHAGSANSGAAVIREMNLARQHPDLYANLLAAQREHYRGIVVVQRNGSLLRTKEGVAGLDEAIRFLRHSRPLGALAFSPGISRAAAEHVADQTNGAFGHGGSDRSNPGVRMNRYGTWNVHWGENISYGKASAREIVIALIIDDGLRGRKHRANIFNATFNYAGAAVGPHARCRTVCSIDFAGGHTERGEIAADALLARN